MKYLSADPLYFLVAIQSLTTDDQNDRFHKTLMRYCCYDSRMRLNFTQIFDAHTLT